jgi:hypothetical protein
MVTKEATDSRILEENQEDKDDNKDKFIPPTFSYDFEFINGFKMSKKVGKSKIKGLFKICNWRSKYVHSYNF